ncbi:MAG TPA: hypothetical protein VGX16_02200 [Solirubrobacteraceae bacterium]|nr:hypothetical protein [Solirubrobacteraceae bacterium]
MGQLTPRRMRALTVGALCAAGLVSSVGVSGSAAPLAHGVSGAPHVVSVARAAKP